VLKWVFERITGLVEALETPIGNMPTPGSLDLTGLDIPPESIETLLSVDVEGWLNELPNIQSYFEMFGERLPEGLYQELSSLRERLSTAGR
jgi:phosphoenolpyruvate carboxykinase (GTP)